MAIPGVPATPTVVDLDTSTTTATATAAATAAAKSKAAVATAAVAASATPQDTVTISSSSQAQPAPSAATIDVAPPVLLEVQELLTQGLTASQIATSLKIPFSAVEVYAGNVVTPATTSAAAPAAVPDKTAP
jgi:DNA-binding NarL/FixJ family response regulator